MKRRPFVRLLLSACGIAAGLAGFAAVVPGSGAAAADTMTLTFNRVDYAYRWAKSGQFEFLPPNDSDLATWKDMVTINLHDSATTGEKLAEVANKVLTNYQRAGKILRTDSKPRTANRPAEHLIVAVLGNADFLEAAFARLMLVDGAGVVAVYSHRIYGKAAGPAMSKWLEAQGSQVESALMAWDRVPAAAALKKLPPRN